MDWRGEAFWGIVLEARDARELGRFYNRLLGWPIHKNEPDWLTLHPGSGVAYLAIQHSEVHEPPIWPAEPGKQQMQAHLDIEVSDLEAAVKHAFDAGATEAAYQPQDNVRVMLDPEGHPFCLYLGS